MLEYKVDVDIADNDGETPLLKACQNGHLEIIKLLLENGAEVNKAKRNGATPLFAANSGGHNEVVEFLLSAGATWPKLCDSNAFNSSDRCRYDPINHTCLDFTENGTTYINKNDRMGNVCYNERHENLTRDPIKTHLQFEAMDVSKIVNNLLKYHIAPEKDGGLSQLFKRKNDEEMNPIRSQRRIQ